MKVLALLFTAVVAVTSVSAKVHATPALDDDTVPTVPEFHRWCYRPGQPCWKAKRALEEINEGFKVHFGDEEY